MNNLKLYILLFWLLSSSVLTGQSLFSENKSSFGIDQSIAPIKNESENYLPVGLPFAKKTTKDTAHYYEYGYDTNYVKRYKDKLVVSLYQSQRTFNLSFIQNEIADPATISRLKYIARSNKSSGISFAYDKIFFSLGVSTPVTESELRRKGKTKYNDYSFSFTDNRYRLELSYRNYKGFYEQNTGIYDSTFTDTSAYFQLPKLNDISFKAKFIYFFNKHKFSYSAVYNNTFRQMKTAGSFFAYSDIFYNSISNPFGFFPTQVDSFYNKYKLFNSLEAYGLTLGGGYTCNLVLWRSLYMNGTLGIAGQFYQQNTTTADKTINNKTLKAGITGSDVRWAIGYNGKNFFMRFSLAFDVTLYNISKISLTSQFVSGTFAYGYRFKFRERNWTRKMKSNKLYKLL